MKGVKFTLYTLQNVYSLYSTSTRTQQCANGYGVNLRSLHILDFGKVSSQTFDV